MIRAVIRYIKKIYLRFSQNVIIKSKVKYTLNSKFEGNNQINNNTVISNSCIGYGTYIGEGSRFLNTTIGKYCSIASNVKTVIATHPTSIFVSTHPAFFSNKRQARIYIYK